MAYASWSVIAGETPTESKWNILGTNDSDFDDRLTKVENTVVSPSYSSTINLDLSLGLIQYLNLTGNVTLTISGSFNKAIVIIYHNGGIRTVTWFSNIDWAFDVVPTLGTGGVGSTDTYGFIKKPDGRWIGLVMTEGN